MLSIKQVQDNHRRLKDTFETACRSNFQGVISTTLKTSTDELFNIDVSAEKHANAMTGSDYYDFYVSSPDLHSLSYILGNDAREYAKSSNQSVDVKKTANGPVSKKLTMDGYINLLENYMSDFQAVKDKDLQLKQDLYDRVRSGNAIEHHDGKYYISESYADMHRELYGNKPTWGRGDMTDIDCPGVRQGAGHLSYTFGPNLMPQDGDGEKTAHFNAGVYDDVDQASVATVKNYCQIRNMHMLSSDNAPGVEPGQFICFTEPYALLCDDIGRNQNPALMDWARYEMAMGHDMMRKEKTLGLNFYETGLAKFPEDNLSTRDLCQSACHNAIRYNNGEPERFNAILAGNRHGEFICYADSDKNITIEPHWVDNRPVKNSIAFHGNEKDLNTVLNTFESVVTDEKKLDKALAEGYQFDAAAMQNTQSTAERSYKLGKDSHGRVKFRGMALLNGVETEVTVSKNYGNHEFNDAEIKALLAGDEVTISDFKTRSGTTMDVTGRLGMQQFQGRSFIGFSRTDMPQARKQPDGLSNVQTSEMSAEEQME